MWIEFFIWPDKDCNRNGYMVTGATDTVSKVFPYQLVRMLCEWPRKWIGMIEVYHQLSFIVFNYTLLEFIYHVELASLVSCNSIIT